MSVKKAQGTFWTFGKKSVLFFKLFFLMIKNNYCHMANLYSLYSLFLVLILGFSSSRL